MISYIRGELISADPDRIVVEAGGIGYNINIPQTVLSGLPAIGFEVKIHTYLQVREDAMQLFGFLTRDDLDVFRLLLGVSGVGPKGALAVLSQLTADDLRFAVLSGDDKAIAKAPGLGKKTAQKIILELKDKLKLEDAFEARSAHAAAAGAGSAAGSGAVGETVEALTALGYSASDAIKTVKSIAGAETMDVEALLSEALKRL